MPRLQDIWTALRLGGNASTAWGSTCCEVIAALMEHLPSDMSVAFLQGLVQRELAACGAADKEDGMYAAAVEERLGNVAHLLTAILRRSFKPPPPPPPPRGSASDDDDDDDDDEKTARNATLAKRATKCYKQRVADVTEAVHAVLEDLVWLLQVQYLPG